MKTAFRPLVALLVCLALGACDEDAKLPKDGAVAQKTDTSRPLYFRAEVTADEGEKSVREAWIRPDRMKVRIDDRRIVVIRSDKQEIWTLDPKNKVGVVSTFAEITAEVARKVAAIEKKIEEYKKNPRLSSEARAGLIAYEEERRRRLDAGTYIGHLEKLDKTEKFHGKIECRLWKYTPSRDDSPIEEIVFYVTGDRDIGDAAKTFFESVREIACHYKTFAPIYPVLNAVTRLDGLPIGITVTTALAGKKRTEQWVLEKVEFADIADEVFDIPGDYKTIEDEKEDGE